MTKILKIVEKFKKIIFQKMTDSAKLYLDNPFDDILLNERPWDEKSIGLNTISVIKPFHIYCTISGHFKHKSNAT